MKSKIIKKLNIHSLKFKMIVTILLSFIIIVAFTLFYSSTASKIIKEKTNTSALKTVEQTNRYLNFLFKKAKDIGYSLTINPTLVKLAKKGELPEEDYYDFYLNLNDLYKNIIYESEINSEIDAIFIYIDNIKSLVTSKYGIYSYDNMKDTMWAETAFNLKNNYEWLNKYNDDEFSRSSEITKSDLLMLVIKADKINKIIDTPTYISVHFRVRDILRIMEGIKTTPNTLIYFLDNNGKVLLAEDNSTINKSIGEIIGISEDNIADIMHQKLSRISLGNKNTYQVIYEDNEVINGGLLVLVPEKELFFEQNRLKFFVIIMITIIALLFIYFIFKLVIEYVNKPVTKLVKHMQIAEEGNFENKIDEKRKDEFGYLYESYNQMVSRIKRLIEELYEQKLIRTQMEVKALQKQINPHFLYNTLEIVNWIAKVNNIDSISKIVISLSNMYRITFNEGHDLIKIKDMIFGVRCYLDIQKTRFGDNFSYEIDIDPKIENYYILNLIIQTIVENAVIHGIDEGNAGNLSASNGLIKIRGYSENEDIYFIVEDNGKGMSEEKLKLVIANTNMPNVVSDSGLRNVQKRIKLLYGDDYGIWLESSQDRGTKVFLKVPSIKELDFEKN